MLDFLGAPIPDRLCRARRENRRLICLDIKGRVQECAIFTRGDTCDSHISGHQFLSSVDQLTSIAKDYRGFCLWFNCRHILKPDVDCLQAELLGHGLRVFDAKADTERDTL